MAELRQFPIPPELALETLQLALEGTETGVWRWDVVADRVTWSANQGPLHGLRRGDAPPKYADWLALIHPDDRDRVHRAVQAALADGARYECEFRAAEADPPRWVHARGHVERDAQGRPVALLGLAIDITQRRQRELALEKLTGELRSLQALTDVALDHLELTALLDELLARIAELLDADIAKVLLYDEDRSTLHVRAARGLPAEAVQLLRIPSGAGAAGRIAAAGRPLILTETADADVILDDLREPGRSLAGVPLRLGDETIGVLVVSSRERTYRERDLLLLELAADRAARAIRQSELYEAARDAALWLQRSLLPEALPAIGGLDAAARYLPGQAGTEVGGDWYDLFALADGRVAIVVGDVVGRGLRAATRMGQVRTALRAYALDARSPREAVERLDRFVAADASERFTTVLVVFLDPRTGVATACCAGHPPPLVVADGRAELAAVVADPPLGAALEPRRDASLRLPHDASLVAYTDGLVEDRAIGIDAGLRHLLAAAQAGGAARDLVDRLVEALRAGERPDDVAVVVVRRLGPRLRRTYPAEPAAVAAARHEVTSFAAAHGAGEALLRDVALAVSEACTNVVMHAYRDRPPGAMHVGVSQVANGFEVRIADEGVGVRPRGDSPGVGLGLQIIARTTADFEIRDAPGGGAELVLRFAGGLR